LDARVGEWEGAAAGVRQALAGQLAEKGEALKGAVQQATKVFQEKQAYKRHYISELTDYEKAERLTQKVDLEDQLYQEAVKAIWSRFGAEGRATLEWLDTFLVSEGTALAEAQEVAGTTLSDRLADELDRLADALGAIGDAFFQAKHDETERLMDALYRYGYSDYQPGYEPVFAHADEEVEDPYPTPVYEESHYSEISEVHESEEEYYHYVSEESHYEEEESYYHEEPVYHEPVVEEPVYHAPVVEEPVYHAPVVVEEPVYHEPTYYSESEDSYISYESESSESTYYRHYSSETSESHGHHHGQDAGHHDEAHYDDYEEVEPYKPEPVHHQAVEEPAHYSAHSATPAPVHHHDHSEDSDDSHDVEINIYNGVGG